MLNWDSLRSERFTIVDRDFESEARERFEVERFDLFCGSFWLRCTRICDRALFARRVWGHLVTGDERY